MSLQSTIYRINNSLISSFAILESWCDRDASFLFRKSKTGVIPFDLLQEILIANDYFLSMVNETGTPTSGSTDGEYTIQPNTGLMMVPPIHKMEWVARINDPTVHTFRALMREQLFNLLCLLDDLHNSRLDAANSSNSARSQRGLRMLEDLANGIANAIQNVREDVPESAYG